MTDTPPPFKLTPRHLFQLGAEILRSVPMAVRAASDMCDWDRREARRRGHALYAGYFTRWRHHFGTAMQCYVVMSVVELFVPKPYGPVHTQDSEQTNKCHAKFGPPLLPMMGRIASTSAARLEGPTRKPLHRVTL